MKDFLKVKSVSSGMTRLLDVFCQKNTLKSPVKNEYSIEDRITFASWLNKLKFIDQQRQNESIGLDIGAMINPTHIGISAYISNSCENLFDLLEKSIKYNKIWYNYAPKTLFFGDQELSVSWDHPVYNETGVFNREMAIAEELQVSIFYTRLQQIFVHPGIHFSLVQLTTPQPQDVKRYENFFNCPVQFNAAKTQIFIPKSELKVKVKKADPILSEILKKQADDILASMSNKDSFVELVNHHILRSIHRHQANLNYVAQKMNISTRVLQNSLKERHLSFKVLLEEIRFKLARQYLADKNLNIIEISFLLSYNKQTSFNRAFKQWSGKSPSQWRENHIDMPD